MSGETTIQTVRGPIDASDLGTTLIHEHILISLVCYWDPTQDESIAYESVSLRNLTDVRANPFACRDNLVLDGVALAADELARFRHSGGSAVVDVTPAGIGRDPRALLWIASQTGLHIVAGCGYYIAASHPPGMSTRTVDDLAEEMLTELTIGIGGTGIRAGVIGEIGMATYPMSDTEERVLKAAAIAQRASGAGIVTHCAPGTESPFEIAGILERAGADLTRVVIGHLDERFRTDISMFQRLATTGVRFGFDTFGRESYNASRHRQHPSDEIRIDAISHLLHAGLRDHIVLAQDICLRHELASFGGQGYSHILDHIVPRLRDRGVTEVDLHHMLVSNPRQVLAGV